MSNEKMLPCPFGCKLIRVEYETILGDKMVAYDHPDNKCFLANKNIRFPIQKNGAPYWRDEYVNWNTRAPSDLREKVEALKNPKRGRTASNDAAIVTDAEIDDVLSEHSGEQKDVLEEVERHTIAEWGTITGITVLDPDGFNRNDIRLDDVLFTREEFNKGAMKSTVNFIASPESETGERTETK